MTTSVFVRKAPQLTGRQWAVLLVLSIAVFLDSLDVAMVGVALPSVKSHLHLSTGSLQWVVSAYVLGYGGFLLLGGRVADLYGRRRVFLLALGVFAVASALGGVATDGTMLIAARFVKGMSAAFTLPAAFSIITTTFEEGPARNKALSVYVGTIATGYSLGLVLGGLLTEFGWRWSFLAPAPVALLTLLVAVRVVPTSEVPRRRGRIDVGGAASLTAAMLLLVYTLVEAPTAGWGSAQTIGLLAAVAVLIVLFIVIERRITAPLVRLGILRSATLVRANLAAMALAGWIGFQFIMVLYTQQLRGWSPLETGLAIFPSGLLVAFISPRMGPLIERFGFAKLTVLGLVTQAIGYGLLLQIGVHSNYAAVMLPGFLLGGFGFAVSYGPINVAAAEGVPAEEQGLAGGLLNTSFQFGGALLLAIVTAVVSAATPSAPGAHATIHGFRAALLIPIIANLIGAAAMVQRRRRGKEALVPTTEPSAKEIPLAHAA